MSGYDDPDSPGNSSVYHTGKKCIEPGCTDPAGTAWSPHWCFAHNVERINRINDQLNRLDEQFIRRAANEDKP